MTLMIRPLKGRPGLAICSSCWIEDHPPLEWIEVPRGWQAPGIRLLVLHATITWITKGD